MNRMINGFKLKSSAPRSRSLRGSKQRYFKTIGAVFVAPTLLIAIKLQNEASRYADSPGEHRYSSPYQDIVLAHCKEDLTWLDQLHNFDPSVCSHTRIYIYSKCNAELNLTETNPLTEKCSTVKKIKNCGTEEYAYIQYILDHYDTMPPTVSFIQGGALTENPHVIYDMMVHIPGTTYKDLSRHVRDGWHFPKEGVAEKEIMRKLFPYLENKTSWLTSWRGMFAVSREQIRLHPEKVYLDLSAKLCNGACDFRNCMMEIWFSALFRCDLHLFGNGDSNQEQCESGVSRGISRSVFEEDYLKDGKCCGSTANNYTNWSRCGKRSVYYSISTINGVLLCIDEAKHFESSTSNRGNLTVSSYSEMVLNEDWKPDLSNLTYNKKSQWSYISPYTEARAEADAM